jgi:ferredoxin--NADP+ reductase
MTAEQTQGHPTTEGALAQLLFAQNAAIGSRSGSAMNRVSSRPQMITWGNPEPAWKKDPGFKSAGEIIGDAFAEKSFSPEWGAKGSATVTAPTSGEQDFLEFSPYYDQSEMPDNTYRPKAPFEGKIISVKRIVGPKATGETCDVIIEHGGDMPYIEGQSYGVIAPGVSPKTGKPNKVRLYSIASSRYGDDQTGKTTTLCVRRATYWCPELKADDPAKKGVCSNFLCDAKPGDVVKMTGPSGKVMLLPEDKPETDIIMVATGTGIAPMRSYLRRLFWDKSPYAKDFKGLAWLFLGVANTDALLYDDDWKRIQEENPDNFRYDVALSREQTNKAGGKMYIQDKVEEYADEVFDRLNKGAHIYFCGLKGMMPGIQEMLERVATSKGLDYAEWSKGLKKNGQWHVEVY